ncbi:hypothetical protein DSO57_1033164 [Entomophthora muscae]|uniref:Uncharacterized protein n=1 Tax=Entomophthora muscae TaxID=34485 RepID=A0ACC2SPA6_9FUNG|nr:hypothetical protein DSO57_1033164 [Entomophthora muscae]
MMEEDSNPFASVQSNSCLYEHANGGNSQGHDHPTATAKAVPLSSADPLNAIKASTSDSQGKNESMYYENNTNSMNLPRLSADSNNSDPQTPSSPHEQNVR